MDLGEQGVFEAPQDLVHGAGHEQLDAHGLQEHGHERAHDEVVRTHLLHHHLKHEGQKSEGTFPFASRHVCFMLRSQ